VAESQCPGGDEFFRIGWPNYGPGRYLCAGDVIHVLILVRSNLLDEIQP